MVAPTARREAVGWLQARGTSVRRACRVVGLSTASWRYQPRLNATNATVLARLQVAGRRAGALRLSTPARPVISSSLNLLRFIGPSPLKGTAEACLMRDTVRPCGTRCSLTQLDLDTSNACSVG